MKIAVFHNFIDNIGGAEIVALTLASELGADLYTTNIDEEKVKKMGFYGLNLNSIGRVPINAPFRHQQALRRFERLDLKKGYDFHIICGDWAVSGAIKNKPNLWYAHSPARELWDLYQYTKNEIVPSSLRWAFDIWVRYNRYLNKKYVRHVSRIVCNSENTSKRVKRYLNRDGVVINPPIETARFHYKSGGDYWLSVNRLFYHKRVDLQIRAFQKLPEEKLIVIGSYEQSAHFKKYANYIYSIKPKNVEILHWVGAGRLAELYANSKGFITTALDEDFGMTPVEAMASGKPVIAPNEGGYKETVIDGVTGRLLDDINENKLIEAIREMGRDLLRYRGACIEQAKKFDTSVFIEKMKEEIKKQGGRGRHLSSEKR